MFHDMQNTRHYGVILVPVGLGDFVAFYSIVSIYVPVAALRRLIANSINCAIGKICAVVLLSGPSLLKCMAHHLSHVGRMLQHLTHKPLS